jgi:hypothetical protein
VSTYDVLVQVTSFRILIFICTRISQKPSRLAISIKQQSPALVDEHYPFSIILENQEPTAVEAIIRVEIKTSENQGNPYDKASALFLKSQIS